MPIRELVALSAAIMGGIFITHPFSFGSAIRQVEFSILREMGRTDSWGDPSLYHHNRYMAPHHKIYSRAQKSIFKLAPEHVEHASK